ncbi:hypothetical protein VE03_02121 [Pseudogymnoascus sp. 23342-1-I1]|nr:hypothetical protein VE03_02121 [Pseudogymnoascus sp. 23342-1-I1]
MVGVPGKFKGCNTCRTRRVKCDNARPKCQKCVASGRECGGYERQMIFIVGTTNERGRCSSHPHRSILTAKQKKEKEKERETETELSRPQVDWHSHSEGERSATLPPTPTPSNRSPPPEVSCVFLHSPSLALNPSFEAEGEAFSLPGLTHSLPEFSDPDSTREFSLHAFSFIRELETPHQRRSDDGDANPRARKKAHLEVDTYSASRNDQVEPATTLLFVYNSTGAPAGEAGPFHCLHGGTSTEIKSRDPSSFQKFPAHQFFANLYRPFACFDAMSRCQATFLARPEWCAAPWEDIPKTDMDRLFDIQVMLPGIFERAKRTESFPPSAYRRLKAKDLLDNCTRLDKSFEEWYNDLKSLSDGPLFWSVDASHAYNPKARGELNALFPITLEFLDVPTALLHLNYWAALCLFYQTIQQVQQNCMEVAPSPPARSSYTPPVPAHSNYSTPTTSAYADPPGMYMGSSPSYSTPSPHASVSPAADLYNPNPAAYEATTYATQPTYAPFQQRTTTYPPASTYPAPTFTTTSLSSTYPAPSLAYTLPTPNPLYPYDLSSPFLFTTTPPDAYATLPLTASGGPFTTPFYNPHSLSSPPQPQPPQASRAPSPSPPPLDPKFSAQATGEMARMICRAILFVLWRGGGGGELVWPLS